MTPKLRTAALTASVALALSACSGSTTTTTPPTTAGQPTTTTTTTTTPPPTEPSTTTTQPSDAGLSPAAQATIDAIASAARSGDLVELADLALSGDVSFNASFGQDFTDPAALADYWSGIEDPSIPEVILGLLDTGYTQTLASYEDGTQVTIYVAPAAMSEDSGPEDRAALVDVFGQATVDSWYADGMFLGWRIGVDADGNWRFLVIGD